jgi:hypothetical protein
MEHHGEGRMLQRRAVHFNGRKKAERVRQEGVRVKIFLSSRPNDLFPPGNSHLFRFLELLKIELPGDISYSNQNKH